MSENMFLSPEELASLTGLKKMKAQIEWLRENSYRFVINAKGHPVVFRNSPQLKDQDDSDGLLTSKQIIRRAKPIKEICGVYFLVNGSEVIYVGKSINLIERVGNHIRNKEMSFDSFYYIEANEDRISEIERAYIIKLNPRMNSAHPLGKNRKVVLIGGYEK